MNGLYNQPPQGLYQPPTAPTEKQLKAARFSGAMYDMQAAFLGQPVQGLVHSIPNSLQETHNKAMAAHQSAQTASRPTSAIQNYEYWKSLPSEAARKEFERRQFAEKMYNLGDRYGATDGSTLDKGLAPDKEINYLTESVGAQDFERQRVGFWADEPKVISSMQGMDEINSIVSTNIQRARDLIGEAQNTTGWGGLLSSLPDHKARELKGLLDNILANNALTSIAEMKASSATGSAMGQTNAEEFRTLQIRLGALDQLSTDKALLDSLRDIETYGTGIQTRLKNQLDRKRLMYSKPYDQVLQDRLNNPEDPYRNGGKGKPNLDQLF